MPAAAERRVAMANFDTVDMLSARPKGVLLALYWFPLAIAYYLWFEVVEVAARW